MPNDFEELIGELRDAGLDDDYIDRLERATAASPIRKERDEYRKQAEATLERANAYRSRLLAHEFSTLGIKARPEHLRVPDDLDLDPDKVRDWAVTAGLIDPPEPQPEPQAELDAHDRISAASQGAGAARSGVITPDIAAEWDAAKWHRFEKQHPVEADSLMQGQQVTGITF